jgi:hypothetical protein
LQKFLCAFASLRETNSMLMENTENVNVEATPAQSPQPKWFHNAWFSRGTLLIAGLFFLLPFININCSGNKLASIRGIDMVIGSELKTETPKSEEKVIKEDPTKAVADSLAMTLKSAADSLSIGLSGTDSLTIGLNGLADSLSAGLSGGLSSLGDSIGKAITEEANPFAMPGDMMGGKDKKIEPNAAAIGAFAFILLALVLSFIRGRALAIVTGVLAILSAGALFMIQVQITDEIQKMMGPFNLVPITAEFTNFYWFTLMFLLVAGIFSFVRSSFNIN